MRGDNGNQPIPVPLCFLTNMSECFLLLNVSPWCLTSPQAHKASRPSAKICITVSLKYISLPLHWDEEERPCFPRGSSSDSISLGHLPQPLLLPPPLRVDETLPFSLPHYFLPIAVTFFFNVLATDACI